jgi:hypothetical protein
MFKGTDDYTLIDLLAHLDPPGFAGFAGLARWFRFGLRLRLRPFRWTPWLVLFPAPTIMFRPFRRLRLRFWTARLARLAAAAARLASLRSLARLARGFRFRLRLGPRRWTPWFGLSPLRRGPFRLRLGLRAA